MSHELFYTSAPKGLQSGSRGFCTVACTAGMPPPLMEKVESLSGYRPLFPPLDAKAGLNPVAWSHLRVVVGSKSYSVLSRTCAAGLDYSERTNKFAHHVVLESHELPPGGPAWLLRQPGFLETKWDGQVRTLPAGRVPPRGDAGPAVCHAWQKLTGDAGWAGVLAEALESNQQALLLFEPGMDLLPLLAEALQLLPAERRWGATFSTYATSLPQGIQCACRGLPRDSAEAAAAARLPGTVVIDLAARKKAAGGPLVETARTGKAVAAAAVPRIPANAVVEVPLPETPAATGNRFVPIGRPAPPPVPGVPAPLRIEPPPPPVPVLPSAVAPAPVAVRGFSGKSFGLGAGVGILATAAAVAALVFGAPEQVAARLPSAETKATPMAEQPDEIKAAAIKEYAAKHQAQIETVALDEYRRTHAAAIEVSARRAYLEDPSKLAAVHKEAVAIYRKEHPAAVQATAAQDYYRENKADFQVKHQKDLYDLALREYVEKHGDKIHEKAVKQYRDDPTKKDLIHKDAVEALKTNPNVKQEAKESFVDKHGPTWKREVVDDYKAKNKDAIHKDAVDALAKEMKDNPNLQPKRGPEIAKVDRQVQLPAPGDTGAVKVLPSISKVLPGKDKVQLQVIGMPFTIHANGRAYDAKAIADGAGVKLTLVQQGDTGSVIDLAKIDLNNDDVTFEWMKITDLDDKKRLASAAELFRNRVLHVSRGGKHHFIGLRQVAPLNASVLGELNLGLARAALSGRASAHASETEAKGGKETRLFPAVFAPLEAEVSVGADGKPIVRLTAPLSMFLKVGERYVEVVRAEETTLK